MRAEEKTMIKKIYIGDSVYAEWNGFQLVLTTENGYGPSNTIYLEDSVIQSLLHYLCGALNVEITVTKKDSVE